MNRKKVIYTFTAIILFTGILKLFVFSIADDPAANQSTFNDKYYIFALSTPKSLTFAGEKVPLDQFDVRERLDRELLLNTYWQSQTMLYHKRANRWFPVIAPILKRNGVPEDFKYLALAESGFVNTSSPAGAVGYWQFLESTAKSYGLEVSEDVDERYNVEKATEAACKYFKEAYSLLGSWTMVAGSYNMGIGGIRKQIEKQRNKNYYDLLLNDETFRYVFRILALKEVISKPSTYGYHFKKSDLYAPYEYSLVVVDSTITNLVDFAENYKTNYKVLKILNPWLRQNALSNRSHKPYTIKILKPGFTGIDEGTEEMIRSIDTLKTILPKSEVTTEEKGFATNEDAVKPSKKKKVKHVVERGESLLTIAKKYQVDVDDIKGWNNLKESKIKSGQKLVIKQE